MGHARNASSGPRHGERQPGSKWRRFKWGGRDSKVEQPAAKRSERQSVRIGLDRMRREDLTL